MWGHLDSLLARMFTGYRPIQRQIVTDALINASLAHRFPDPRYFAWMQEANPWLGLPERLLRPPPGWPGCWQPPQHAGPAERRALPLLYGGSWTSCTYRDVAEAVAESLTENDSGPVTRKPEVNERTVATACGAGQLPAIAGRGFALAGGHSRWHR